MTAHVTKRLQSPKSPYPLPYSPRTREIRPGAAAARPFTRIEGSRNRQTGGFGLSLTIARNIARRFGGDVTLRNLGGGGLRAELKIPLADTAKAPAAG